MQEFCLFAIPGCPHKAKEVAIEVSPGLPARSPGPGLGRVAALAQPFWSGQPLPARGQTSWGFYISSGMAYVSSSVVMKPQDSAGPQLANLSRWTVMASPDTEFYLDFLTSFSGTHWVVMYFAFQSLQLVQPLHTPSLSPLSLYLLSLFSPHLSFLPVPSPLPQHAFAPLCTESHGDRPVCKGRIFAPWILDHRMFPSRRQPYRNSPLEAKGPGRRDDRRGRVLYLTLFSRQTPE
jgi:hypothetical protein